MGRPRSEFKKDQFYFWRFDPGKGALSENEWKLEQESKLNSNRDNYNKEDEVPDSNETNMLLRQMIQLMTALVAIDPVIQMDHQLVGAILKKSKNK